MGFENGQLEWIRSLVTNNHGIVVWPEADEDWPMVSGGRTDMIVEVLQFWMAFPSPPVKVGLNPGRALHASKNSLE